MTAISIYCNFKKVYNNMFIVKKIVDIQISKEETKNNYYILTTQR